MPKFPEPTNKRTRRQIVNDILEAIALEELAIAHLINAEAEKIQAFTGAYGGFPTSPSNKQINEFQDNLARILEALANKQKTLVRKMELTRIFPNDEEEDTVVDDYE